MPLWFTQVISVQPNMQIELNKNNSIYAEKLLLHEGAINSKLKDVVSIQGVTVDSKNFPQLNNFKVGDYLYIYVTDYSKYEGLAYPTILTKNTDRLIKEGRKSEVLSHYIKSTRFTSDVSIQEYQKKVIDESETIVVDEGVIFSNKPLDNTPRYPNTIFKYYNNSSFILIIRHFSFVIILIRIVAYLMLGYILDSI